MEGRVTQPYEDRAAKILRQIDEVLGSNALSWQTASTLAARLTFFSQSIFGCTGRAATKPRYSTQSPRWAIADSDAC